MSQVWTTLIEIQNLLVAEFDRTGKEIQEPGMERFNQPGWINRVWTSENYRRAHVDVVDARDSKGLWMMHCCIFPHLHSAAPIFGFDVIAGARKITGCFYDYSPTVDDEHPMLDWFAYETRKLEWNKTRKLPEWAERIFSPYMVAAGNVQDEEELAQIFDMAKRGIKHYLTTVGEFHHTAENSKEAQNYYAQNQKQNPHTPRVMASLGLNEEDVRVFIQDCLFPELR